MHAQPHATLTTIYLLPARLHAQLPEGAGRAQVKERYKDLARRLHPDKCQLAAATEAFQKVSRAYNNLLAHMA